MLCDEAKNPSGTIATFGMSALLRRVALSRSGRILTSLAAGLSAGLGLVALAPALSVPVLAIVDPIGRVWLNGLQMTIIPLVFGLLVTGVAATSEAAQASRLAGRTLMTFVVLLCISSISAAVVTLALLSAFPLPASAGTALSAAFQSGSQMQFPSVAAFIVGLVPTNPIQAAATDALLPFIIFTLAFSFAVARLPGEQRSAVVNVLKAIADSMLIVVDWLLRIAPIGVFALAAAVSIRAGSAAFGALIHYVLIVAAVGVAVSALSLPVAVLGGRTRLRDFLSAVAPAGAVAISTQSSLASLPAMLIAADKLDVRVEASRTILPLAVAMFRFTGPAMNLAVAIYVAHAVGLHLSLTQICTGVVVAAVTTLGAVSLPGTISFVSSIAPIAMAMGVPIAPLALLVAMETFPDIVRTVGNVFMDVAVTTTISIRSVEAASCAVAPPNCCQR